MPATLETLPIGPAILPRVVDSAPASFAASAACLAARSAIFSSAVIKKPGFTAAAPPSATFVATGSAVLAAPSATFSATGSAPFPKPSLSMRFLEASHPAAAPFFTEVPTFNANFPSIAAPSPISPYCIAV